MKILLLFLGVFFYTSFSLANCEPAEAQFIGKIQEMRIVIEDSGHTLCFLRVGDFSFFKASQVCPLNPSDFKSLMLPDSTCNMDLGRKVSGVVSVNAAGEVSFD